MCGYPVLNYTWSMWVGKSKIVHVYSGGFSRTWDTTLNEDQVKERALGELRNRGVVVEKVYIKRFFYSYKQVGGPY